MNNHIHRGGGDSSPFFSIVIPVYNTEKYISRCLESCINQTFSNIEIIVVDDCGLDNAIHIAEQYTKMDKRINIVYNSKNLGTFHTRINGENHSKGVYILHLDSDDYIELNTCETLYPHCKKQKYDLIAFAFFFLKSNNQKERRIPMLGEINYPSTDFFSCGLSNKVFKKSFLVHINTLLLNIVGKIPNISMSEDGLKLIIIALNHPKYLGIDSALYNYVYNPKSITSSFENPFKIRKDIKDIKKIQLINKILFKHYHTQENSLFLQNIKNHYKKIEKDLQRLYHHSKAYENKSFAYPINFIKSLHYTHSIQTYIKTIIRIFLYLITIGKIKL